MSHVLSQKKAIVLLRGHGWHVTRGGKHAVKMTKEGERPITLPRHRGGDYSKDLTNAIRRQAGLNSEEDSRWSSRSSYIKSQQDSGPRSSSSRDASRQAGR